MTREGSSIPPITGTKDEVRINLRSDKVTQKRLRVVAAWDDTTMTNALEAAIYVYAEKISDQQRREALEELKGQEAP